MTSDTKCTRKHRQHYADLGSTSYANKRAHSDKFILEMRGPCGVRARRPVAGQERSNAKTEQGWKDTLRMVGEGMMDARDSAWEEHSHAQLVTTAPRGTPGVNADRENTASSH